MFLAFRLLDGVFILLINVKIPTIVGILIFIGRINFVLSCVEHDIFITLGLIVMKISCACYSAGSMVVTVCRNNLLSFSMICLNIFFSTICDKTNGNPKVLLRIVSGIV